MGNEITMRVGFEGAPGGDAALQENLAKAKAAQEEASRATEKAAQEEAAHLALVQAQYGQLGPAAAKAYGQAEAAASEAAAAVSRFGDAAAKGGKGAERAAAQAAVAIEKLENEIRELRAAGGNVEVLEGQLRELNAQMERNVATAGKMRRALADAKDEFKASTARAGELEGQIGSLEGILNVLGASTLGNVASKAVALQGAFLITVAAAKQIFDILDALTKQAGAAWEESLSRQDAAMRAASGETGQYAANLRNVLAKNGYDVANASLADLMKMEEEFVGRLRARGAEMAKLSTQIKGDQKSLQDDTAVTLGALKDLGAEQLNNTAIAGRALDVVRELVARYKELGQEVPEALREWSVALERIAGQHESLLSILDRVLSAVGVRGPAAIDKQIDALREYAGEVERSGAVTADQAGLILSQIDQIRKALELLPESQQEAAAGMIASLEDLEERYRGLANVALSSFGVQTPDAIDRSIAKVDGLLAAFGPLGKVTAEQAAIVVAELQKILEAIALLPAEQKAAMVDQETAIRALADQYGEIAVRRKQYAADILAAEEAQLAREKEIVAERQELLSTFASTFEQLQSKLAGKQGGDAAAAEVEKLKTELAGLEDLAILTPEQVARMAELEDQIGSATVASAAFATGNKAASLSVEEVDGALVGLIDSLKDTEGGFANLPLAARAAVENMVGRLQQAAQEGTATGDTLNDVFLTVGRIVDEAGGSMGDLGTAINRANEDTLNLRREFGELEQGLAKTETAAKLLGETQKDAGTVAKEAAEAAVTAAKAQTEALEGTQKAQAANLELLERTATVWERIVGFAEAYKECLGSTSL